MALQTGSALQFKRRDGVAFDRTSYYSNSQTIEYGCRFVCPSYIINSVPSRGS